MADAPLSPMVAWASDLHAMAVRLAEVTECHRALRTTQLLDGCKLSLVLPGDLGKLDLPLPTTPEDQAYFVQEALSSLGDEAVSLWAKLHEITSSANEYLTTKQLAAQAAAQSPGG